MGFQSKDLQLDIIPASAPGADVKFRDANHELNEEKRKSARRKEYVFKEDYTITCKIIHRIYTAKNHIIM